MSKVSSTNSLKEQCPIKNFTKQHNFVTPKLKACADENKRINVALEMTKFVLDWVENIVGKRENTGYQHFLLFPQCFQKPSLARLLKVVIVW